MNGLRQMLLECCRYVAWAIGGVLGLGLVCGGMAAPVDPEPPRYPAWFVHPPSEGGHWAVGYARTYATWSTSVAEARADAYTRLHRRWELRLNGERLYEAVPGLPMAFRGARQESTPLQDTLRAVTYVDSARVGALTLVLAHVPESDTVDGFPPPVVSLSRPFAADPPSWVEHGRSSSGETVRAVGVAPRYYYPASSWTLAEHYARWELAVRAGAHVDRLRKTTSDRQHTVMRVRADVEMRRVRVVARWQDADACYVLMEADVRPRVPPR